MMSNSYNQYFDKNLDDLKTPKQTFDEMISWNAAQDIIYWKARAMSLEIENARLKEMIHDIMIPHESQEIDEKNSQDPQVLYLSMEQMCINDRIAFNPSHILHENKEIHSKKKKSQKRNIQPKSQDVLSFVNKLGEKEKSSKLLYGPCAARIRGMEAALQVNYNQHRENPETMYWPNIPLNF